MDDLAVMVTDVFGTAYKIWADGRTEGFGPGAVIINRVPQLIAEAIEKDREIELGYEGMETADLNAVTGISAEMLGVGEERRVECPECGERVIVPHKSDCSIGLATKKVDHHGCL